MKLYKYITFALASAAALSCSKMDELVPQGSSLTSAQVQSVIDQLPVRADASFNGMYTKLGEPLSVYGSAQDRPDDWGFIMMAFSGDAEAADLVLANNNYNWFSVCGELSSRNADYANPYIRYAAPYNEIAICNEVINSYPKDATDREVLYKIAQAKAIRAFSYLHLAPYFQFSYQTSKDLPCVPLVTEEAVDFANNPRATVAKVYELIISDLTYAIEKLEGYDRPDKSRIDKQTAYALRARAYLYMGEWIKAAEDAEAAAEGYTPATIEELSVPSFYDISEHNWIWGYDMTLANAQINPMATSSSWVRSFSANGYAPAVGVYARINNILYDKIPETDVRKGWWVDKTLNSPLLEDISWEGASGLDLALLEIDNVKLPFDPYTNVKFGCYTVGTVNNDEDWPFIRVEEMLLIQAEGYIKGGQEAKGKKILEDFIKTYRDPAYSVDATRRTLADEVWFQRRVELWGEGFANPDLRRLNKPLVRFLGTDTESNWPDAFRFNLKSDDGWWLMRFTTSETNTNLAIVDNTGGTQPVKYQNPTERDGVTDENL